MIFVVDFSSFTSIRVKRSKWMNEEREGKRGNEEEEGWNKEVHTHDDELTVHYNRLIGDTRGQKILFVYFYDRELLQ